MRRNPVTIDALNALPGSVLVQCWLPVVRVPAPTGSAAVGIAAPARRSAHARRAHGVSGVGEHEQRRRRMTTVANDEVGSRVRRDPDHRRRLRGLKTTAESMYR